MQCSLISRISKRFTQPNNPLYIKLKILLPQLQEKNVPMSTNVSPNCWSPSSV